MRHHLTVLSLVTLGLLAVPSFLGAAEPSEVIDLATVDDGDDLLSRVYGATGSGNLGLPVAGGPDVDGDGHGDLGVGFFQADPLGRSNAGEVNLIFGSGSLGERIDSALFQARILRLIGDGVGETAGSEIWIDDVTGDGLGDLLICRQNYSPDGDRIGAGALTLVVGDPSLRDLAAAPGAVDLRTPPPGLTLTTILGAAALDRLGIWVRTGDIDGDGIADIALGADQASSAGESHHGTVYVVRGGPHLATAGIVDLADFGTTALAGQLARIDPPPASVDFHFGATTQIADLDGNGRGEVMAAATLLRGGAFLPPSGAPPGSTHSAGGTDQGTLYIAWDDNFPAPPWPAGLTIDMATPPGSRTVLDGGPGNERFGEEILGGLDYDGDGTRDLFVGDIAGDGSSGVNGPQSGTGHVVYDAASLKGRSLDLDTLPGDVRITTILGPRIGALGGDTAAQGDFNGDGRADLAYAAPHGHPLGRRNAGQFFILYGQEGGWPSLIDTRDGQLPDPSAVRLIEIQGALGDMGFDTGDTLGYSAAAADIDGDGRTDLITNEMVGNGVGPGAIDVGNLIVLGGAQMSGDEPPPATCIAADDAFCLQGGRFRAEVVWRDFDDVTGSGRVVPGGSSDDSGLFWFFGADNWEMLVKVIDGCAFNQRYWVFAAAITNVEYTLKVTDTVTGLFKEYPNGLGVSARATTDSDAFATCPQ